MLRAAFVTAVSTPCLVLSTAGSNVPNAAMTKVMMTDQGLSGRGAVCLDGTDAGFYFAPAADAANAKHWQLYFEGGGWCYDAMDCWGRSYSSLGSSSSWPATMGVGGIMSDDCATNPDFCKYNRVYMKYCDGNSFSGNRAEPLVVKGLDGKDKPLYFRGKRIIDAVLETLMNKYGLSTAENVLLTGCSAGGLATYLHTDYVRESLIGLGVTLKRYKSAPISGFFLLHKTVDGKDVYPEEMQEIFKLANSTAGVNRYCAAAMAGSDKMWMCNFAQFAYYYTKAPIFPLNSAFDSWQAGCIFGARLVPGFPDKQQDVENGKCNVAPGYEDCLADPEKCNATQVSAVNRYITDFDTIMSKGGSFTKAGNGAFVHSCYTHCEAQSASWNTFKVGGVSMQEAVSKWWNSDTDPASKHSYGACLFHSTSPHQCNPTCGEGQQDSEELLALVV